MRALVLCALTACGYPALDKGNTDANTGDGHMTDGREKDGTVGPQCDAPTMYGTPTAASQSGDYYPGTGSNPDELAYGADIATSDAVFIMVFSDDPKFGGGGISAPVTIPISGAELNFDSCGGCVVIGAKCNNCNPENSSGTGTWYMATAGTLSLTQVNPHIKGTLTNVTFEHVTIANSGSNPTYHSTPVGDGCITKITSMAFDAAVTNH